MKPLSSTDVIWKPVGVSGGKGKQQNPVMRMPMPDLFVGGGFDSRGGIRWPVSISRMARGVRCPAKYCELQPDSLHSHKQI